MGEFRVAHGIVEPVVEVHHPIGQDLCLVREIMRIQKNCHLFPKGICSVIKVLSLVRQSERKLHKILQFEGDIVPKGRIVKAVPRIGAPAPASSTAPATGTTTGTTTKSPVIEPDAVGLGGGIGPAVVGGQTGRPRNMGAFVGAI